MTESYPVPPPELVQQWTALANEEEGCKAWSAIATQAAQWGADQELKACCEWLNGDKTYEQSYPKMLRAARRPKPPSLKEQALAILPERSSDASFLTVHFKDVDLLRRALEQLPNAL